MLVLFSMVLIRVIDQLTFFVKRWFILKDWT